jgi:microcystin degradation protein MlrC
VIADVCDNAGGGAGSDSTFILEEVLRRGLKGYAFGLFWDPVVVEFAMDAGVGAALKLRLGGKSGASAGRPLDVEAVVLAVHRDMFQAGIGFRWPVGHAVALDVAGNRVIVCSVRGQIFSPTCFVDLGVVPSMVRAFVVKSSQHFHEQFAPIAREVLYCDTPGSLTLKFDASRYALLPRPIWPLDDVRM